MQTMFRRTIASVLLLMMLCFLPSGLALSYPQKPITLIVPYGAGGTADLAARQIAMQLKKHLKVPVTVVNRGGASGSLGAAAVLDAPSDGYTLLLAADSMGTMRVMGISAVSYHDFTPISPLVNDPKVIVVRKDSPYQSVQDLLTDMKERPGKVKMSYTGPGGSGHVQSLILRHFGFQSANIAYAGGADAIVAVLGRQVDFTNANYATVSSYAASGDLKLLAVCSTHRLPDQPDVPALGEVIEGAEALLSIPYTPLSLLVKKDVPKEACAVLRAAVQEAVKEKEWVDFCQNNSLEKLYETYDTVDKAEAFFAAWEARVSWLLYDAKAAPNSPDRFDIPRPQ